MSLPEASLPEAMGEAGWSYDDATGGFVKPGVGWVSWDQAQAIFAAAERGEDVAVEAQNKTVAAITHRVANS